MAATESKMIPLGTEVPYFKLQDAVTGYWVSTDDLRDGKPLLVMFICNHCPYVMHIIEKLVEISREFIEKGVNIVAINPNDYSAYPEDSPEKMIEYSKKYDYPFPYLIDDTQEVARKFDAACTPDFFLFDSNMQLIYRGQFDDSRPGNNIEVTGADLRKALEYAINNKTIDFPQKPSIGCSIKWKK
ncbi:thioredoxin family protein [Bacteroidetes/Chlorobi group bacterium Naka2016]|jgi:thiol-disulfide isomerase/thioredoxin|nr:MAG: thioredoxin family protein [Bacteroidetes/Chlorobi group bacterium Naka2016]